MNFYNQFYFNILCKLLFLNKGFNYEITTSIKSRTQSY